MDDYVIPQDEERISVKEFREKTRDFHQNAKKMGLPFSRRVFVATTCSAYECLLNDKKLTPLRIKVSTMQKIWRDNSVKTLAAYWRESDRVIRAAWPDVDVSRSALVKWPLFVQRYLYEFEPAAAEDLDAEASYQVVLNDDLARKPHMQGFLHLLMAIELA